MTEKEGEGKKQGYKKTKIKAKIMSPLHKNNKWQAN